MMSVVGGTVVAKLTSLGDAGSYRYGAFTLFDQNLFSSGWDILSIGRQYSTSITETAGAAFHQLFFGSATLIDMGFQTIAFIGIYKLLCAVDQSTRRYLALFVLSPSFNIWSSVAGKEALLVFFVGTLGAYLVRLYKNEAKIGVLEIVSALGVYIFKIHYAPAFVAIFFFIYIGKHVRQQIAFVIGSGSFSICLLYVYKDTVDRMAFDIVPHFLGFGSSRPAYWVEQYDVFYKAPYGMFQGFFGPTLDESTGGILKIAAFIESAGLVAMLLFLLLRNIARLPVYSLLVGAISLFWLLFASYPLGIMNPGSAIRYRTGHLLLVFVIFAVIFSRDNFIEWRRSTGRARG
jgi:hypothetical protein